MVRRTLIGLSLCAVLVMSAVAVAVAGSSPEYGGRIEKDPNTFLGFDLTGKAHNQTVKHGSANQVNVACTLDGFSGRLGTIKIKAAKVTNGKFSGKGSGSLLQMRAVGFPETYAYKIKGKIKGKNASGTISVTAKGQGNRCYSGILKWKATKPPPAP